MFGPNRKKTLTMHILIISWTSMPISMIFRLAVKFAKKKTFFGQFEKNLPGKMRPYITIKPRTQHFQNFQKFRIRKKNPKNTFLGQFEKNLDVAHLHNITDHHANFDNFLPSRYMRSDVYKNWKKKSLKNSLKIHFLANS